MTIITFLLVWLGVSLVLALSIGCFLRESDKREKLTNLSDKKLDKETQMNLVQPPQKSNLDYLTKTLIN